MPRVANYVQDRQFADSFNPTFDLFLKNKFPRYLSHVWVDERPMQLSGVDLIVMDKDGDCHTIDAKVNRFGVSPDDFILETWQDTQRDRPGWFITGKAEWLAFGKAVENNYVKLWLVKKKRLKEWIDAHPGDVKVEARDFSDRGGKSTEVILCPTKHIADFGLGPFWIEKADVPVTLTGTSPESGPN